MSKRLHLALSVLVGVFLSTSVAPFKVQERYPSNLAWLFGVNGKGDGNERETPILCQSEECEKIAKIMLQSMDKSVNPCDDFYEYACGKWPEHNPVPEGSGSWGLWDILERNVDRQIEEIIKEGPKDEDLLAVKLAKKWYSACMDTDAMDKQGLGPLLSTLSRIGGWPMIMDPDEWDEREYDWLKVDDQYMRLMGRNVFHDVRVYEYGYNETATVVHIDTPHLPPGAYSLWSGSFSSSDEVDDNSSNEDPSDEEKRSDEREDSQEPEESESKNDDDNSNEGKKSTGKLGRRKHKKSTYTKKGRNGDKMAKRHQGSRIESKQRIKRRAAFAATRVDVKRRRLTRLDRSSNGRKRSKAMHDAASTATPRFTTEPPNDDDDGYVQARLRYADYISKVARALARERDIKISKQDLDKDIEDMIEFQVKLTEIVLESGEDLELTLDGFQQWYDEKNPETDESKIDWVHKITELFDEANVAVDSDLDVEVGSPDYFEALVPLLDATSSRTIVNYIHWNFLSQIIKTTTSELRALYDAWEEVDDEERDLRSSRCIREVEMSDILSYEYVRKHFPENISKTAMDMIDDIQKEVEYLIKESDWMDEDTKDFALAKLVNMNKWLGYPNWYKNSTIVKRYFQGLIVGKSYYENTLGYQRYRKWNSLRKLTRDDEELDDVWWISPVTLNAMFDPEGNMIAFSAADFQSPFFAYGRPQTINFGIIGFIMAHEVNHGFDDTGHLYDKNGDAMEWLSTMAEAYGKRAECFVNQFNNYPVDKVKNERIENYGNQTIGDNIADTMGLQAAFRAYRRRERECDGKPDAVLPGLEKFSNDQLFFLSFANLWCEASDSATEMQRARRDEHSTVRLRVIGSVSNSKDFAKAYDCPVDSAMNPETKCNIWK